MKAKEIIRLVENDGWFFVRQSGSHKVFKHPVKKSIVVIPDHGGKDVPIGTAKSILKQAGLK